MSDRSAQPAAPTEPPGEVIVANPRVMKLPCLARQRSVSRSVFERDSHHPVEHLDDFRRRETEIAVSPVPYRSEQSRLGELSQMRAGRLRGDARSIGKFGSREGAAVNKRRKHDRSAGFPDQSGDLGYQRPRNHVLNVASHPPRHGRTTSTVVEVGASVLLLVLLSRIAIIGVRSATAISALARSFVCANDATRVTRLDRIGF